MSLSQILIQSKTGADEPVAHEEGADEPVADKPETEEPE